MAQAQLSAVLAQGGGDAALGEALASQRRAFLSDGPPSYETRIDRLNRLSAVIKRNKDAVVKAISEDFGNRSRHETLIAEIMGSLDAVGHAKRHLRDWMKSKRRPLDRLKFGLARARIHYQPLGVIGIIAPWNYPFYLAISPLAPALAAGNRVMIKPSELTPHLAELLAKMIGEVFKPEEVTVITGGPAIGEAFSQLAFDHLLYTGSTQVGRKVMLAAADKLVPVTLELGGKSPVIVADDYAIDKAAGSIWAGKLLNAGQTCIAPDYAFVPSKRRDDFVLASKQAVSRMYPTLARNPDYTSIVADRHYERIQRLLTDARAKGAKTVEINPAGEELGNQRKIAPTLVLDVNDDMAIMKEEIFGPVMPIKTYDRAEEALDYINAHPRPLALYVFSDNVATQDKVLTYTTSGGVTVNDTLFHVATESLPFGGVGPSGLGAYHGWEGFATFSHAKATFYQAKWNMAGMLRPPFGAKIERMLGMLLGK